MWWLLVGVVALLQAGADVFSNGLVSAGTFVVHLGFCLKIVNEFLFGPRLDVVDTLIYGQDVAAYPGAAKLVLVRQAFTLAIILMAVALFVVTSVVVYNVGQTVIAVACSLWRASARVLALLCRIGCSSISYACAVAPGVGLTICHLLARLAAATVRAFTATSIVVSPVLLRRFKILAHQADCARTMLVPVIGRTTLCVACSLWRALPKALALVCSLACLGIVAAYYVYVFLLAVMPAIVPALTCIARIASRALVTFATAAIDISSFVLFWLRALSPLAVRATSTIKNTVSVRLSIVEYFIWPEKRMLAGMTMAFELLCAWLPRQRAGYWVLSFAEQEAADSRCLALVRYVPPFSSRAVKVDVDVLASSNGTSRHSPETSADDESEAETCCLALVVYVPPLSSRLTSPRSDTPCRIVPSNLQLSSWFTLHDLFFRCNVSCLVPKPLVTASVGIVYITKAQAREWAPVKYNTPDADSSILSAVQGKKKTRRGHRGGKKLTGWQRKQRKEAKARAAAEAEAAAAAAA